MSVENAFSAYKGALTFSQISGTASDKISVILPCAPNTNGGFTSISALYAGVGGSWFQGASIPVFQCRVVVSTARLIFIKSDGTSLKRSDITGNGSIFLT